MFTDWSEITTIDVTEGITVVYLTGNDVTTGHPISVEDLKAQISSIKIEMEPEVKDCLPSPSAFDNRPCYGGEELERIDSLKKLPPSCIKAP